MTRSTPAVLAPALVLAAVFALGLCAQAPRPSSLPTLAQLNAALQAGEADKALSLFYSLTASGPGAAEAHNLACRVRFTLEQWDAAVQECEKAVQLDNQNSGFHMWFARALGEKAGRASFLTAFSLGKRVRAEFEEAVRLNPGNADALADLGEFYQQAPGIVGGGTDKAEAIAAQLDKVDPARAHELRARLAEGRKDYGTQERELHQAIASASHPAFQWMTLASFYRRRERWTDMESAIHSCITAASRDKSAGVALYDAASILAQANRDPQLAARLLEDYLASSSKTEEAPAFVAHTRLARLKDKLGDATAAARELEAARALAHDYKPAGDARH